MTLEEIVVTKLQQLPEHERQQLLVFIDTWIEQHRTADPSDIQQAIAAVQSTWATVTLDQQTLRWVAEDKELEYDLIQLLKDGVQGKYAERYRAGTNLVLLAPDVAHAFPTEEAVNQALRLVLQLAKIPTGATTSPSEQ